MRDDDELRFRPELIQHRNEAPDVRVIERCIYLVEQAERARLREEDPEQQRERHKCALTARQQVDPLRLLSSRCRVDLDVAIERGLRMLEAQVALPAAEESH